MKGALVIGGDYQGLGIIRTLGKNGVPVYLIDRGLCIGRSSKFTNKFFYCPRDEALLLKFLINLAEKEKIKDWVVYPTTDEMVRFLSIHREELDRYYKLPTPPWEITQFFYNKRLTYTLADSLGIPIPKTFYLEEKDRIHFLPLQFPVIIKPIVQGVFYKKTKKKALLARNKRELAKKYSFALKIVRPSDLMIQEVIPGGTHNLYSFSSLVKKGRAIASLCARRIRQHPMDFGRASTFVEKVSIPEIEEMGLRILSKINYYGLSEVEFMWDPRDKKYKLLEVNARTWGWHTLGNQVGIEFAFLLYKDLTEGINGSYKGSILENAKWVRLLTDIPLGVREIIRGKMGLSGYLTSLKGRKEYAVWSFKDPLPFLVEFLLLPYLSKTRGF